MVPAKACKVSYKRNKTTAATRCQVARIPSSAASCRERSSERPALSKVDVDVVIVGGGFAGITAARDLADAGMRCVVLEAHETVGGRALHRPFPEMPDVASELGATWVALGHQPQMAREVARYQPALTRQDAAQQTLYDVGGERREGNPLTMADAECFEEACFRLSEAARRFDADRPAWDQAMDDLDVSVAEFFADVDLRPAARDLILDQAASSLGARPDEASVLGLVLILAASGSRIAGWLSRELHWFAAGTRSLLESMLSSPAIDVHCATPVAAVDHAPAGVTVSAADGRRFSARACVVAVPTNALHRIAFTPQLSEAKQRAIAMRHCGRAYKVNMVVRGMPHSVGAVGTDAPVHSVRTLRALSGDRQLVTTLGSAGSEPVAALAEPRRLQAALRRFVPDVELLGVDFHDWNADPYFNGTWRTPAAGEFFDVARALAVRESSLAFAGADISPSAWQNFLEGAVASGRLAAQQIADQLVTTRHLGRR